MFSTLRKKTTQKSLFCAWALRKNVIKIRLNLLFTKLNNSQEKSCVKQKKMSRNKFSARIDPFHL